MPTPRDPPHGSVDLVGAGPGDPGLMTRLGADSLARAGAVVYDHLVHPALLDLAPPTADRILAGKRAGKCVLRQPEINDLLVTLAKQGKHVVRLKGGDPLVFGRGSEEAERLAAEGIPFRIIPGVTAALGASAYAGLPLTHRGDSSAVAFVTGHDEPGDSASRVDWAALARFPGTLVIYMGVGRLRSICSALIEGGKPRATPAALVHSATLPTQKTIVANLVDLPDAVERSGIGPPAVLVVGDVARHHQAIGWFEARPLFGTTIVVTRPAEEASRSGEVLESLGAEVILAPTIEILPPEDFGPVDSSLARMGEFDWLVFTSANGVRHFLDRMESTGQDARALGRVKIAAIGPATAEALRSYRLRADLVPDSNRSEFLAETLIERVRGGRVLLARADRGREFLKAELERVAIVEEVVAYRNADAVSLPPGVAERIAGGSVDWITATSSAIVKRLHALLPDEARAKVGRGVKLASISPITSDAARVLGWDVAVEAEEYTWNGVVRAILASL